MLSQSQEEGDYHQRLLSSRRDIFTGLVKITPIFLESPHIFYFLIFFKSFFFIYFYQLEANYFTTLQWVLSHIDMNQPWSYMYSSSRSPRPPPSPPNSSGSSQCVSSYILVTFPQTPRFAQPSLQTLKSHHFFGSSFSQGGSRGHVKTCMLCSSVDLSYVNLILVLGQRH